MAPRTTDPASWHAYVSSARTFAEAQDRIEEAVAAGVDFAALPARSPMPLTKKFAASLDSAAATADERRLAVQAARTAHLTRAVVRRVERGYLALEGTISGSPTAFLIGRGTVLCELDSPYGRELRASAAREA